MSYKNESLFIFWHVVLFLLLCGRMRLQDASKILNGDPLKNIEKVEKENIDWIRWDHIHIDILNII